MTFKELVRAAIGGEMRDVSAFESEVGLFSGAPNSEEINSFFAELALEKRKRLLQLGRILKEGTGFRQRREELARSPEAALKARVIRAGQASSVYADLSKQMKKPEYAEIMKALALRELETQYAIKKLRAGFRPQPEK